MAKRFIALASNGKGVAGLLPFFLWGRLLPLLLSGLLLSACAEQREPSFQLSGMTMGTTYQLTVVTPGTLVNPERINELQLELDAILQAFNGIASTYIADSELSQLNIATVNEWHGVGENLYEMLLLATEISVLSAGAFDITVGPVVDRWGFGPKARQEPPTSEELQALLARIGYDKLAIDFADQRVKKQADIRLDLSAIAKGFAVDQVAAWLEYHGYKHYLVEIGGELRVLGHNSKGHPWRLGIEQPDTMPGQVQRAVALSHGAIATSGDYRNYYEVDGERVSHTIDPRTAAPIRHNLASVTVLAESAAEADAWATALNVLGPAPGLALVNELDLAVYMLIRQADGGFIATMSESFKQRQ